MRYAGWICMSSSLHRFNLYHHVWIRTPEKVPHHASIYAQMPSTQHSADLHCNARAGRPCIPLADPKVIGKHPSIIFIIFLMLPFFCLFDWHNLPTERINFGASNFRELQPRVTSQGMPGRILSDTQSSQRPCAVGDILHLWGKVVSTCLCEPTDLFLRMLQCHLHHFSPISPWEK